MWNFTSLQNASSSAASPITWQALTWSRSFCPRQHREDELGLIGRCLEERKKKKAQQQKKLKTFQKSFSKSVRQMMMKRANSAASRCSAFYFIQFVQFFYWGKHVLVSLKPTLHKQHALKTSEGEKKGNVRAREKCSQRERIWAIVLWVFWRSWCRQTVDLHYSLSSFHNTQRNISGPGAYFRKQHFQTTLISSPSSAAKSS